MPRFDAVIFDWSGNLVHDPPLQERLRAAMRSLGTVDDAAVDEICTRVLRAEADPDVEAALRTADTSLASYLAAEGLLFERAGLDLDLAHALLHVDEHEDFRPLFPDVLAVLEDLRAQGCRLIVLSDIHFDIRPLLTRQGAGRFIDDYVLSFEQGVQKPDPRMFEFALQLSGCARERTLMVGDRSTHDGAAAECGITTLVLPPLPTFGPRGLSMVRSLVT